VQKDLKKLIAYSSVSHMGFCVLGMFALNAEGVGGSVAYMVNHGLSTGALFLMVGMLYERLHTRDMTNFGGLAKLMPLWAGFFVFFALASVGLPGLNGFVGEFLCLVGTFKAQGVLGPGFAIVGGLGIILAAVYILYMVGKVVWGPLKLPADYDAKHHPLKDMDAREVLTVLPLAALCLFLGFFPTPMLVGMEESVAKVTQPAERVLAQRAQQQREQQPGEATPKLTDREDQAAAQARAEAAPKPRLGDRPTPDLSDGPLGRPSAGRPGSGLLTAKDRPVGPARGR
jgi:NADH-quinone oxidoreductase subunit M